MRFRSVLLSLLVTIGSVAAIPSAFAAPPSSTPRKPTYPGLAKRVPSGAWVLQIVRDDDPTRFKLDWHEQLSAMKASTCSEAIDKAHWYQDLFYQGDSAAHFDNCAFAEGAALIAAKVNIIRTQGAVADKNKKAQADALEALGQALHAIQDFYSHSNYLERLDRSQPADQHVELVVLPLWTEAGRAELEKQAAAGLVSGTWAIGKPKHCKPISEDKPALSHDELAKDSLGTKSGRSPLTHGPQWKLDKGFHGAFSLARQATEQFVKEVIPPQLVSACGGGLAVLVPEDAREKH